VIWELMEFKESVVDNIDDNDEEPGMHLNNI